MSGPDITVRWALDGLSSLSELRRTVYATALRTDVPADAVDGFVVAVSEVATNALMHGAPPFRVVLSAAAQALQFAVTDGEGGIRDAPALT
ncbi:MAG: ATP-binding protein, partial [Actinomycetota bacterium]|nr:ATP-binding protein [Actinomycetota bacterium]